MKYEFEKTDLTIYYATIEADSFEDAVSQLGKADWNMSDGWIDELGYQGGYYGADYDAYKAGHHERVVEQVFAYSGGTGAVKGDSCDIGRIVRYEEVSVDRRQYAQKDRTGNAQRVGQRQHGYNYGTLAVDQHGNSEEYQRNCPRIFAYDALQTVLHHGQVVAEIGIGQPCNSVDGYYGNHT